MLNKTCDFFSAKAIENIVIINFSEKFLQHTTDLTTKDNRCYLCAIWVCC